MKQKIFQLVKPLTKHIRIFGFAQPVRHKFSEKLHS